MSDEARRTVVLDDDPTGTQAVAGVPALLRWDATRIRAALDEGPGAVHLLTNTRALQPQAAEAVTADAAAAAREADPGARLVLRGDSTLRGHLLEEYRAAARVAFPQRPPVLVLVPALPAAGRVTLGGVHWLRTPDGGRLPLSETEYARDGGFAYRSSRLLDWAQERSAGALPAAAGTEVTLEALREHGGPAVADAIARAAAGGGPAACAPDAETLGDLERIARGVREAEARGIPLLVRCAPTFAGVLAGTLATGLVPPPRASGGGVLVACGSYVSGTTGQLRHLREHLGVEPIEADVRALASDRPADEIARVAARASSELAGGGLAVVATPRERPADLVDLGSGERIARGLGAIVGAVRPGPDVVLAKGGITSQVVLEEGLGVDQAVAAGPVAAGVALWDVRVRGRRMAYLVFPGNVGGPSLLTDVVRMVRGG